VSGAPLVVVGDALLDRDLDGRVERLAPDAPVPVVDDPAERRRPGGAALAATLAALGGRAVVLVTALAADEAGVTLRELLEAAGVEVVDLGLAGPTPEKIRVRADGRSLLRLDRATRPGQVGPPGDAARRALTGAAAVLVADYGRGLAAEPGVRAALAGLPARVPVVWDPHPRGPAPVPGARLATPNRAEAARFVPEVPGDGLAPVTARARLLADRWQVAAVAVTLGPGGALLVQGAGAPMVMPAPATTGGDPCGAGDRFAATAAALLADGALPSEAVAGAVAAASAFVATGGAATIQPLLGTPERQAPIPGPPNREGRPTGNEVAPVVHTPALDRALGLIAAVRARGGTAVATGGCFDLLHAGHVATLRAARALGDCLVVCLNSDDSVRRLKGPGRPLVRLADRVAVLEALGCVDVVVPFDERTPEAVLQRLRPDVFAKGGDYALADLPEAELLATWGGQAVVLPYLEGRSTTQLMKEVVRRDSH
jgi:D-beta-D-heptose 7-phosphate kinase/D-beta-D-heptose 1-phosphate adenosyltransferase